MRAMREGITQKMDDFGIRVPNKEEEEIDEEDRLAEKDRDNVVIVRH